MPIRWSHTKVGLCWPKIENFGLIYIKIDRQTKSEVNRTKNNHLASKKPHKWPMGISQLGFFSNVSITQNFVTSATINIFP